MVSTFFNAMSAKHEIIKGANESKYMDICECLMSKLVRRMKLIDDIFEGGINILKVEQKNGETSREFMEDVFQRGFELIFEKNKFNRIHLKNHEMNLKNMVVHLDYFGLNSFNKQSNQNENLKDYVIAEFGN